MNRMFFVFIFLFSLFGYGKNQIVAISEIEIENKKIITLGDVTNIKDFPELLSKSLESIELGNAPELGEERIFTSSAIALILRKKMTKQELQKYQLRIPNQVRVKIKDNSLTQENLKRELMGHWQVKCQECRFKIKYINFPRISSSESVENWTLDAGETLPKGNFNVALYIQNKDKSSRQYWVSGHVSLFKKVPVAKKMLNLGEKFSLNNIGIEEREITHSMDTAPELSELVGKSANQVIRSGTIIWHNVVLREKAILKGELVKIVIGGEKFELSTVGKANRDAYLGERVDITPIGTSKPLFGAVINKGEVRIE